MDQQTRLTNMGFLQNFTGGNKEKMAKYINMFLQFAPGQLQTIETHLANQDWDSLRGAAHSLKPQISYMGIKSQEEVIRTIEHSAEEKTNLDQLPAIIEGFKTNLNAAFAELQDELKNL